MYMARLLRVQVGVCALLLGSCTDAGLYAIGAGGPSGPDRAEFRGTTCVPIAAGDAFPVKVLFALQGGAGQDRQVTGEIVDAVNKVMEQFSSTNVSFSIAAFHSLATGLQGSFTRDQGLAMALAKYAAFTEGGPVSHRAPLLLAQSILSGDMQTGCRGQVARTRYLVVVLVTSADTSCANPVFNAGIETRCNMLLPNEDQCSSCELSRVTETLKGLTSRYNAGEVTVQPVYVRTVADISTRFQAAAIARAGGTELIEASPGSIDRSLTAINYGSLQRQLRLKRLIAMNRNVQVRESQQFVDSDGDGVSDEQEALLGSDPTLVDSDFDGLLDGVEVKMGLKPVPTVIGDTACTDVTACTTGQVCWKGFCANSSADVVKGCDFTADGDGDRLNDCEERVLGTDSCISDSDGDGLPDLVEFLGNTNPLLPEDLADDDRDGLSNVGEIETHSDPLSADLEFQRDRGYGYAISEAEPTPDGRACYDINIYNVGVMTTLQRPSPDGSGLTIPRGINDIYIYMQVGRENDPRGTGIGSLFIPQVRFLPPANRRPRGVVSFTPDDFVSGY
jgi:hypothetical protein